MGNEVVSGKPPPQSRPQLPSSEGLTVAAHLKRIKQLAHDLGLHGGPAAADVADQIEQDIDAVLRTLTRKRR